MEHHAPVGLVQAESFGDGGGDQADGQALFEWHSGGQVGGQGQRRQHLGDPDRCHMSGVVRRMSRSQRDFADRIRCVFFDDHRDWPVIGGC
ncbi:hypothetical protein [Nocardia sp. NPDC056000]|uniref:hypothetical protein n=1 Tax=Nocardia sp. NPDC056000 TaxID=3345674 RepID=UPI0035E35831